MMSLYTFNALATICLYVFILISLLQLLNKPVQAAIQELQQVRVLGWRITFTLCNWHLCCLFFSFDIMPVFEYLNSYNKSYGQWVTVEYLHFSK